MANLLCADLSGCPRDCKAYRAATQTECFGLRAVCRLGAAAPAEPAGPARREAAAEGAVAQPAVRSAQAAVSTVQAGGRAGQQCHRRGQHWVYCQETQASGSDECSEVAERGCRRLWPALCAALLAACCAVVLCKPSMHRRSQAVKRMVEEEIQLQAEMPQLRAPVWKQPTDAPACDQSYAHVLPFDGHHDTWPMHCSATSMDGLASHHG